MKKEFLGLKDKVVIITGASSGIGYYTALRFAEAGAKVVVAARRADKLQKLATKIKKIGGKVLVVPTDMLDKKQVANLISTTVKRFKKIDILVNNAGVLEFHEFLKISDESWEKILNVNVRGYMWAGQMVASEMAKKKKGAIINISSIAAFAAFPQITAYNISKAAIIMLTKNMANELGSLGIRVNAVCPGIIETEMTAGMLSDPKQVKGFLTKTPLGRVGQGIDIADPTLFLASDMSSYITGIALVVDGGWICHL